MKTASRILIVPTLAATVLLGACAPRAPVTGSVNAPDGVAIKYETVGRGEPALVFVHCWTCNRGYWDKQAKYFAGNRQVVRLDLAGHGESGQTRKDYSIEAFGADVGAVVEQLNLKRVVLVGSSMGGPVSVEAAKRLGDRVVGVVGIDSFYSGFEVPKDPKKAQEMVNGFMKPLEDNYPEASAKFMTGFIAPGADPKVVALVGNTTASANREMALSAMRHVFEWYRVNTPAALDALGARLRNINADPKADRQPLHPSVTLVAGAGHFVALEKPAEFNRALEKILVEFAAKPTDKK